MNNWYVEQVPPDIILSIVLIIIIFFVGYQLLVNKYNKLLLSKSNPGYISPKTPYYDYIEKQRIRNEYRKKYDYIKDCYYR